MSRFVYQQMFPKLRHFWPVSSYQYLVARGS